MITSEISSLTENNTVYKSVEIRGEKSQFNFMKVTGRFNYVTVTKVHANPFGGRIGKQFESFDNAQEAYKQPELKAMILLAEIVLK